MNNRQQAVFMGAHDEPMPELVGELIATFQTDVKFYRSTDNPMYGLFVAHTIRMLEEFSAKLAKSGIRHAIVTGSRSNLGDVMRSLSAGAIDCVLMTTSIVGVGGFRLPVKRLTIASLNPLTPHMAIQLLSRADLNAQVRSLVWLKQEPKSSDTAKLYPNLRVTFNDKLTESQQDSIVSTLIALGCVEKVDLGTSKYGVFHVSETITKDAASQVHRALTNQPDKDHP